MKGKTVLVTGGSGFIGSHLVDRLLETGNHVISVDNFDPYYPKEIKLKNMEQAKKHKNFKFYEADIRDSNSMGKIFRENDFDLVFHIAAKAGVRASIKDPLSYNDVNINGTLNLLKISLDSNIKKFIYSSSSSVYGNPEYLPIDEKHPTKPISPYGASKLGGEKYCMVFDKVYGLKTISLRLFTVYGPRQRPDEAICKFTNLIFKNKPIKIYGDGKQTRDFTYISDIVDGLVLSAKKPSHGDVFNLGSGKRINVNGLVDMLERTMGKKVKRDYTKRQKGDVKDTWAEMKKAKNILGYEPKVDIKSGVEKFHTYFRE